MSGKTPTASARRKTAPESHARNEGLWRTVLAGPGHTLADAFANLEQAPQVWRHEKRDLLGARVMLTPAEGEGYWELTRIRDDFYVILMNFAYKNPRFELVPGDGLIQFNFKVSGDMTLEVSRHERLRFNRPSLLLWGQPPGVNIGEWSARERMVAISVRPEFLLGHFLTSIVAMPPRLQAFLEHSCDQLAYCQVPLTAQMFEIATKLLNNPYTGALALVYTEALTLELLCAAVGSFCSSLAASSAEYTERELRCLQAARGLLLRQLSPPPTIAQIARSVGMAQTVLTRAFKALYGQTIFDFSLRCRMQQALILLRDRHWSVERVSEAVGYRHATSFATAFRRHFGIRPLEVRRVKSSPTLDGARSTKHSNS